MTSENAVTSKGLVQLALAKNHAEVVDGARVELHPEYHVSGWVSVPLVVTLELQQTGSRRQTEVTNQTIKIRTRKERANLGLPRCPPSKAGLVQW